MTREREIVRVRRLPLVLLGLGAVVLTPLARPLETAGPRAAPPPVVIDPATASVWELTLLPGIGPVRARRLVALRTRPGGDWRAMMRRWQRRTHDPETPTTPPSPTGTPSRR